MLLFDEKSLTVEERKTNQETKKHIVQVQLLLSKIRSELELRSAAHDLSKMKHPEVTVFTKYTPMLAETTYGSEKYKQYLASMKEGALDHHYKHNRHHPEHFADGIQGMNLIDIVEMLCDWKAATLRHNDGDIEKSLEINRGRFGISDQLLRILLNTVRDMGWD